MNLEVLVEEGFLFMVLKAQTLGCINASQL